MKRGDLLTFLEDVEHGSFAAYLREHGEDPAAAFSKRCEWASVQDLDTCSEARFFTKHQADLRALLDEGEKNWHIRLRRQNRRSPRVDKELIEQQPVVGFDPVEPHFESADAQLLTTLDCLTRPMTIPIRERGQGDGELELSIPSLTEEEARPVVNEEVPKREIQKWIYLSVAMLTGGFALLLVGALLRG